MMKSLLFFFLLGLGTMMAQENGLRKTYIQEGELIKFSEYYENGNLLKQVFYLMVKTMEYGKVLISMGQKNPRCVFQGKQS